MANRNKMRRRVLRWLVVTIVLVLLIVLAAVRNGQRLSNPLTMPPWEKALEVPTITFAHDQDQDGTDDLRDIVRGARDEVKRAPVYRNAYYAGGYPPENEGVCTDVIWRALKEAGFDFKSSLDADIRAHLGDYPRVGGTPEPNIDFRRVPNLNAFFKKYALPLTTDVKPGDVDNLKEWQPGDIVVWGAPADHIGIISDRRRTDGVPYVLHNAGPHANEGDILLTWYSKIIGHYRYPKL